MDLFLSQILSGLSSGAIYASLALAIVMIYQAIEHINFAQGEMAMFSTFIAWTLIVNYNVSYWLAFLIVLIVSFFGGILVERIVFAPIHDAPILSHLIVFLGLFAIFNSLAGYIWGHTIKSFPSPFPEASFRGLVGLHQLGTVAFVGFLLLLIYVFFSFTRLGLAMRAAAANPVSAQLTGIRVKWMTALGWGLASALGAVSGMLVAPVVFLDPHMMGGILIYSFAASLLGGVNSPGGAVLGGFIVGVLENLVGTYVEFIGNELKLTFAFILITGVLLFKPNGLFGRTVVTRV
ncbi:MAG: branched-chain amino acid ABC transporter permease [Deltaproteobacteria bacterium]|mgnify:FL=1|jgi:branched-chain amino acid transport system permease protein|nr:branched-chain amino acid ABC transporter permease [Deltaproteobacteria bacterium]MBT6501787.1 branched-chain amino acid ABC transporter permease [Deltaproteobacteria bacterium]